MEQEKTYKWIRERIRELHAGTISADDQSQLDRLAQEDPFIADALEGFRSHPDQPHQEYLRSLAGRIRPYQRPRRRWLIPNLTVTAVAASLMLIVGFWAVMNRMSKEASPEFAGGETERTYHITGSGDTTVILPAEEDFDAQNDLAVAADKTETAPSAEKPQALQRSTGRSDEHDENVSAANPQRPNAIESAADASDAEPSPPAAPATVYDAETIATSRAIDEPKKVLADPGFFANQMDPDIMGRRATGRVLSPQGDPLIGANLIVRNTNLGTVSDLDGRFELYLPKPESKIDVSFTGYEAAEVTLRQGEEDIAIVLPAAAQPSDANVTGQVREAVRKNLDAAPQMEAKTQARDEQVEYTDYLRANARFPLKDNLYTPGRNVLVEFAVSSTGEPSRIKVIESSDDSELDEEAVRLIRKGPKWACSYERYPCVVTYTIYFQ